MGEADRSAACGSLRVPRAYGEWNGMWRAFCKACKGYFFRRESRFPSQGHRKCGMRFCDQPAARQHNRQDAEMPSRQENIEATGPSNGAIYSGAAGLGPLGTLGTSFDASWNEGGWQCQLPIGAGRDERRVCLPGGRAAGDTGRMRERIGVIWAVLAVVTLGLFAPAILNDFVNYDDPAYVTSNAHVQSGLSWGNVAWAFTTAEASNWHPLTWVSHMVDCQLYGLRPGGHHLTSVLLHVANTLLLFGLMRRMTGAVWRSAAVAAFFGWHPLRVESVAWVAERKDVLSTLFWLLTMLAYVRYVEGKHQTPNTKHTPPPGGSGAASQKSSKVWYGVSLVCFALGLMAKPMLVTLPFVLLLVDYWPLGRMAVGGGSKDGGRGEEGVPWGRLVLEKAPFLALAAGSSVVTFLAQRKGGAVSSLAVLSVGQRLANALVSYVRYMGKLVWPQNLSVLYPHPGSWPAWVVVASGMALVAVSVAVVWAARREPYLAVGWFWFVGGLAPVIGLVQVGVQSMADRYTYVPVIGLLIMICWGVPELMARWPAGRRAMAFGAGVALALCALATTAQVRYWGNSQDLFRHAVAVTSRNYLAYNNLGFFLDHEGKVDEALENYRKSIEINPSYDEAQNNMGYALAEKGQSAEAIPYYLAALRVQPKLAEAHNNLANALSALGRSDEALAEYRRALECKPELADAHNNLGIALAMSGKFAEAEEHLHEAIRLSPKYASAHMNLGNTLAVQHKLDAAAREYQVALELKPDDAQAHNNLGNVLFEEGHREEAAKQYGRALELNRNNPEANYNLGMVLLQEGKRDLALEHFREALRLKPDYPEAQRQVAALSAAR
jgi:protein O-mannosyl-transferase